MAKYKLTLASLKFISAVDDPAQETATVRLLKRRGPESLVEATARVVKTADELGLVFGWALTTKANGEDYFDLHGDNIVEEDLIKVAAEFMENGGLTDEMHDDKPDGKVVFAMPLTAEVAKSFGIETETTGLMVAIRPSADVFAKFKSGELKGFSIAGAGVREEVTARKSNGIEVRVATMFPSEIEALVAKAIDAHATKSTSRTTAANVNPTEKNMDELQQLKDQVAALTAELASMKDHLSAAKSEAEMTDEEKAHAAKLETSEQKRFRGLAKSERCAEVAKALEADPIVAVVEGTIYRKSTPGSQLAVKLLAQEAAVEKAAVRKLAAETIGKLAGDDATHDAIIKAVRTSGESAEMQAKMLETLKGANALLVSKSVAPGFGGTEPTNDESPNTQLEALAVKHAQEKGITKTAAMTAVMKTAEGRALYAKSVGRA